MILTKEQSFLKAQNQFTEMFRLVEQAVEKGLRIDQVERQLFVQMLTIALSLLEGFVVGQGDGDSGPEVQRDGHGLRRLAEKRSRRYLSIFGELLITRFVYAAREGQKIEQVPLDERLGLPAGEFSYVLEDWLQRMCVQEAFGEAVPSLKELLGVAPSVRAAEEMNRRLAEDADAACPAAARR